MKSKLILTAIMSVSLTLNVVTFAPQCLTHSPEAPVQVAEITPAQHGFDLMLKRINGVK